MTPLQLIGGYSAVANGGNLMEPHLVRSMGSKKERGAVVVRRVLRPETAAQLQSMLENVVENGTGESAQVAGYRIAGKTGTAQKVDPETGEYSEKNYVSSFAGYFPARDPQFTVLVVIDSSQVGYYGSVVAAPLFKKIVRRIISLRAVAPSLPLPLRPNPPGRVLPKVKSPTVPALAPHLPRPSLMRRTHAGKEKKAVG